MVMRTYDDDNNNKKEERYIMRMATKPLRCYDDDGYDLHDHINGE